MKSNFEKDSLYLIIKREIDKVDVYGLLDGGSPKDEFELEAKMIFEKLEKGMTKEDISKVMSEVFSNMFNEDFEPQLFDKCAINIEKELINKK